MELSIRGYARHRGVDESTVRTAIKKGRITKNENDKIDPVIADKQWEANSDPAQSKSVVSGVEGSQSRSSSVQNSYQQSRQPSSRPSGGSRGGAMPRGGGRR